MDFYQELFLTAVITVILAILIKLASLGDADGHDPRASPPTAAAAPHDRARRRPSLVAAGCGGVSVKKKRVRFQEISEEPVNDSLPAVEVSGSDRIEKTEVVGDGDREEIADHIESGTRVRFQEISEEPVNDSLPAVEVSGSDRIEKTEVVGDDDREEIADHIESGTRVRFQEISEEPVNDSLPAVEVSGSDRIEKTEVVGDDDREEIADHIESGESVRDDQPEIAKSEDARIPGSELAEEIAGENESRGAEDVSLEIGKFEGRLGGEGVALEGIQEEGCESGVGAGEKGGIGDEVLMEGSLLHGEDDWEGIERSELEELFAAAMAYVGVDGGNVVSGLSSDVLMQLYGLQKVAMEGPCYESQPLALKVSARAKWHAWQRLGNMAQEVAMEQYISLLSDSISGWMGEKPGRNDCLNEGNDPHEEQGSGTRASDPSSSLNSSCKIDERLPTDSSHMEGDDLSVSPKFSGQGISGAFFLNLLSPTTGRFLSFYW